MIDHDLEVDAIETASDNLVLEFEAAGRVNFASAQNDVPVIRSLKIKNPTKTAFEGLKLTLAASPAVIREKTWIIDRLSPGDDCALSDLNTPLDIEKLAGLNEAERGYLCLTLENDSGVLVKERSGLELLARDQWGGLADMDRLLAAYVSPNDAVVAGILKVASRLLEAAGQDGSMEGYQSNDPRRAWMIAGAIWSAATGLGLTYANPPASFERDGQKIRFPQRIKAEGLATCLDTSLLLSAAWEQAGLNPVVLFTEGHAFAGVWLVQRDFGQVTEPDVVAVRKASRAREFIPVETTFLTKRPTISLEEAAEAGRARLTEEREHEFLVAVDIARARSARIRPLASHIPAVGEVSEPEADAAPAALPKPIDLGVLPGELVETVPDTAKGRIERWQSKLLDLSLRNRLLNFKTTKQTVPCMVPETGQLEDALADGSSFRAYPLWEDDPIGERRVPADERERIISSAVSDAFSRVQVTVDLDKSEMDKRLLSLFRKAKSDLQEGGTNTLFLAAGFLRWQREGEEKHYRAPLLLVPIKLERRSARSEFRIAHHEDEVRFNATLLEFLKRDFDLSLPELEGDLPRDDSGIDLPLIFETMRARVRDITGFEVIEEIAISTFSFSKYLMWKDLVDRTEELRNNRLVAHLVDNPDRAFDTGGGEPLRPDELDTRLAPKDLVTPLPADSSQLAAVAAAMEGRDFVLIGPPGTGKSQTIANIICQCLAHGKTVLFVAEKAAALDVVHRRLEAHGLGDAVLELHSNKTDRKRVLAQLGRGWDRTAARTDADWLEVNEKLRIERDRLNEYVFAVHSKSKQSFSIFEAIGWTAASPRGIALEFADKDAHDAESFRALEDIAEMLGRTRAATSSVPQMALIQATDWSFALEESIISSAKALRVAAGRLTTAGETLVKELGLAPEPAMPAVRIDLLDRLAERGNDDAEDLAAVPELSARDLNAALDLFAERLKRLDEEKRRLSASYEEAEALRMPLDQMDADWRAANATFWPFSALKRRGVRKLMQTYASSGAANPQSDIAPLREMRGIFEALGTDPVAPIAGKERSAARAARLVEQAVSLRRAMDEASKVSSDPVAFGGACAALVGGAQGKLSEAIRGWCASRSEFKSSVSDLIKCDAVIPDRISLGDLVREIDIVLGNREKLADWTRWRDARVRADTRGLGPLADWLESGELTGDCVRAFRCAYARWWLPLALDASEPLRRFAHWEHEDIIRTFGELDDRAAEMAPAEVMRRINHSLPARDGVPRNSELGKLRHQLGLQRPSIAIRPLLGSLTETFPKLAPCVLMSPLSIAQYLPAGQATFDVVIFDEASQITTWDAVGAIARARQSIIVGDPKQLPPTNFFGRSDDGADEDSDPLLGDMPSILDEVANAGIPTRRLNWHYRSKDEALIAFSNHHYYDGRLVTFPAPATGSEALRFHNIEGTYARGSGRTNADEAKAIVKMIERRLSAWLEWPEEKRLTLGVITFNSQQQGLILDFLDDLRRRRGDLEWFFEDDREEPVIVKNLENIQGDERDVMLFSITFGPDAAGKLSMAFGALNQDGGEKRLNVAVTRARQELHVFSSIRHDQIDLSRTRAIGVRHLKTFLDYAERGAIALPAAESGSLGPAENPFEAAVADSFAAKGWEVRTQIGVSGFRIDLGVVHPSRGGAYLAGIECDGATYHGSATARDRDKVRQAVLEGLGWKILRIWSTDWFRDPKTVVERLHNQLEALLAEEQAASEMEESRDEVDDDFGAPRALPSPGWEEVGEDIAMPTSQQAPNNFKREISAAAPASPMSGFGERPNALENGPSQTPDIDPDAFFEARYLSQLRQMVDGIVAEKAPLPLTELARDIARAHGWHRTGRRIIERVEVAALHADCRAEGQSVFVWPAGGYSDRVSFRGLGERSIQEVSRNEIASVLDGIAEDLTYSEDPALELARTLGIARLSNSARGYLDETMRWHRGGNSV